MVVDWLIDCSIDWLTWALFQLQSTTENLFVGYSFTAGIDFGFMNPIKFWMSLVTLSTARCLYQVQWIPSTLYDSLYVLTLSSLLYRPCVATLVTAVISPRLICSHWLELLAFGHQAAICLPSLKRFSLAREGLWLLSWLPEAVNALSEMRMSSTPSGIEQLWTTKIDTKWSSNRICCDLLRQLVDFENNSTIYYDNYNTVQSKRGELHITNYKFRLLISYLIAKLVKKKLHLRIVLPSLDVLFSDQVWILTRFTSWRVV